MGVVDIELGLNTFPLQNSLFVIDLYFSAFWNLVNETMKCIGCPLCLSDISFSQSLELPFLDLDRDSIRAIS